MANESNRYREHIFALLVCHTRGDQGAARYRASTTDTAHEPLINRLRRGKLAATGAVASANSELMHPRAPSHAQDPDYVRIHDVEAIRLRQCCSTRRREHRSVQSVDAEGESVTIVRPASDSACAKIPRGEALVSRIAAPYHGEGRLV